MFVSNPVTFVPDSAQAAKEDDSDKILLLMRKIRSGREKEWEWERERKKKKRRRTPFPWFASKDIFMLPGTLSLSLPFSLSSFLVVSLACDFPSTLFFCLLSFKKCNILIYLNCYLRTREKVLFLKCQKITIFNPFEVYESSVWIECTWKRVAAKCLKLRVRIPRLRVSHNLVNTKFP